MRGWSFPTDTPVASAAKSFVAPVPSVGSMATVKNTMPKPPRKCISERQKRMEWGSVSILPSAVAPVVVKPETASKKASERRPVEHPRMNGSDPMMVNMTHVAATER